MVKISVQIVEMLTKLVGFMD